MAEEHSQMYKNVGKAEQETSRRRRTETTIQLRREKRGNELNKRRNIDETAEYESEVSDYEKDKNQIQYSFAEARKILTENPSIDDLRNVFTFLRKQLSRPKNVPLDEIVQEGLVQALVQGLNVDDTKVQYESAWALTNVVSGESHHTQAAVNCGATQGLIKTAYIEDDALAEQCFWGVANIIGDCAQLRDHAIECGFLDVFTHYVTKKLSTIKISFVRTLAWVCTNLCRHKQPQISIKHVALILPFIKKFLEFNDPATQQDSCWALSYLSDSNDENLDLIAKADILPVVRNLLGSKIPEMLGPAVRVFGNFTSGNDSHTQSVIALGILPRDIPGIFQSASQKVVKEVLWLLSNVLAGTPAQIQAVIEARLVPHILQYLRRGDFRVQTEAAWGISNLCHSGTREQVYFLATLQPFQYLVPLLNIRHVDFITHILSIIKSVLGAVAALNPEHLDEYKQSFEEAGGIDAVEELQNHENAAIYELCFEIIQTYFSDDDEENVLPGAPPKGDAETEINKPVFNF
uniref:Importin subunit alpha n=1 Tax=Panagrolaimus superbus TaxID=310955 RepID=A0A914YT35_9BILA